jgi:hypothetical protein
MMKQDPKEMMELGTWLGRACRRKNLNAQNLWSPLKLASLPIV